MKHVLNRGVVCALMYALSANLACADSDGQLWMSAGVRYPVSKKFNLEAAQHLRFDEDISSFDNIKTDLEASWKVASWLRTGTGYRFTLEADDDDGLEREHRFHLQGQPKKSLGPVDVSYRLRFQEGLEFKDEWEFEHEFRNRLSVDIDTDTDVTPGVSFEAFTIVLGDEPIVQDKLRLTSSVEVQPNKRHVGELFYRMEIPLEDEDDLLEHIVGIEYQYRIKR